MRQSDRTRCGSDQQLERLLHNDAAPAELREHIADCPACQQRLDHLTAHRTLRPTVTPVEGERGALQLRLAELRQLANGDGSQAGNPTDEYEFLGPPREADDLGVLGEYRIRRELGRGGMGIVFLAHDPALRRDVAIKVLRPERLDRESRARFVREARAAAKIRHDAIVPVHCVADPPDGVPYFVMPWIPGPTLQQRIDADGPLGSVVAASMARQVARGLTAAHRSGLIHRDIKPANIILDEEGRPRIMDFGLVRTMEAGESVTRTGVCPGTPEYMSPEQLLAPASVDARTDVYGLGVTLYEMLTGRRPFQGTGELLLQRVVTATCPSPRRWNSQVPRDLDTICMHALHGDRERRYASAELLAADLERWLQGRPIHARPVTSWQRLLKWSRRQPALAAVAGLLVLSVVLGASTAAYLWQQAAHHQAAAGKEVAQRKRSEALLRAQREEHDRQSATFYEQILRLVTSTQPQSNLSYDAQPTNSGEVTAHVARITRALDPARPEYAATVAWLQAYMKLSNQDLDGARQQFLKAKRELRPLLDNDASNELYRWMLASTHHHLGVIRKRTGLYSAAAEHLRTAVRLLEPLAPGGRDRSLELVASWIQLAVAYRLADSGSRDIDAPDLAAEALEKGAGLLATLDSSDSADPSVTIAMAAAYTGLAAEQRRTLARPMVAFKSFNRAAHYWSLAITRDRKNANLLAQYGSTLRQLGDLRRRQRKFHDACRYFELATEAFAHAYDLSADKTTAQARWNVVLRDLGELYTAARWPDRLIGLAEHRRRQWPRDPRMLFEAACDLASAVRLSRGDARGQLVRRTLEHLDLAVACGFRDLPELRGRPELDSIRNTPGYSRLFQKVQGDLTAGSNRSPGRFDRDRRRD